MKVALLILFYSLFPLLIVYGCHKSKVLNKIGAVVLTYIVGLLMGNIGIFPRASEAFREILNGKTFLPKQEAMDLFSRHDITSSDIWLNQISMLQDTIMTIVIPLSIPLLLFSLNIRNSIKIVKKGLFSLVLAIVSLLSMIFLGDLIFGDAISDSWKISGMMVGLYTGGTPNLAALATALQVDPTLFILTHTYDLIVGIFLVLFFLTIAQKTLNKILPAFDKNKHLARGKAKEIIRETDGADYFMAFQNKNGLLHLLKAIGLSILIFAIGGGASLLVPGEYQMVTVILIITTLAIATSLIPSIHKIEKTFEFGMYLILIFSLVVSSMADLSIIINIQYLNLFFYVLIAVFGSLIVHVILSYIFGVDTDTTIISITALSTSPPFVPVVAGALKNKDIILTGITIGVIGYAIGNYLGTLIAFILK